MNMFDGVTCPDVSEHVGADQNIKPEWAIRNAFPLEYTTKKFRTVS